MTDVIILCGGLGTRLRSAIPDLPKPMASIADKPFLELLVDHFVACGFHRFILCVGYKADVVKRHFTRNYVPSKRELTILFSDEEQPLGTGGAVKHCEGLVRSQMALIVNGDSYCPLDVHAMLEFHRRHGGIISIAVVRAASYLDGGAIELGEQNAIVSFREKPGIETKYMSAGIYLFEREIFSAIPSGRSCSLEHEIFPSLLTKGVYGYLTSQNLYDIGSPEKLDLFRKYWTASHSSHL